MSENFKKFQKKIQEGYSNKEMQLVNSNKLRKNQNKLIKNLGQEKKKICNIISCKQRTNFVKMNKY